MASHVHGRGQSEKNEYPYIKFSAHNFLTLRPDSLVGLCVKISRTFPKGLDAYEHPAALNKMNLFTFDQAKYFSFRTVREYSGGLRRRHFGHLFAL